MSHDKALYKAAVHYGLACTLYALFS